MTKISNLYTLTNYISANSSGNVVIAAPASGYALDVTGTGRFTGALSGTSATFTTTSTVPLTVETTSGNSGIIIKTSSSTYNWLLGAQYNVGNGFEISPSTAVGGTTFTTPVFKILNTGAATFLFDNSSNGITYNRNVSGTTYELGSVRNSGSDILYQGTANVFINADSNSDSTGADRVVKFGNRGVEYMRLDASGNVGIGTTSPVMPLNVASSGSAGQQFVITDTAYSASGKHWYMQVANGKLYFGNATDSGGAFTSLADRLTILNSGNVGIGTTSPINLLGLQASSAGQRVLNIYNGLTGADTYVSIGSQYNTGNSNVNSEIRFGNELLNNAPSYLAFATSTGSSPTERMRITSGGLVGIGITSPNEQLHVVGGIKSQYPGGNITMYGNYTGGNAGFDCTNGLIFVNGGSERMRITSGGNVGIGTTTISTNSLIRELVIGQGITNGVSKLSLRSESNSLTADISLSSYLGENLMAISTTSNIPMLFATNSTERMRISSGGEVAIGMTSSAYAKVSIKSNSATAYAGFNVYALSNGNFTYMNHNNNVGIIGTEFGAGGTGQTPLTFQVGGTERLRINTNGDIICGITASYDTAIIWNNDFTGTTRAKIWGNGSPALYIQAGGSAGVYLASGGTSWTAVSDERLKTDLMPIENATEKVIQLRTMIGRYLTDDDTKRRSFLIAQDVLEVLPEAVDIDAKTGMMGVQYTEVIPLLVASIKELSAKVTALENK